LRDKVARRSEQDITNTNFPKPKGWQANYLKRRIDTLQDEARKIRFKMFELNENERTKEESFFHNELEMLKKRSTGATMN
jgi:hypothetical protein